MRRSRTSAPLTELRHGLGQRSAALVIEGVALATAAGMNPNIGKSPDQLSPDLARTLADRLLTNAKGAILGAFGGLPPGKWSSLR